jgi:hypothetical protein
MYCEFALWCSSVIWFRCCNYFQIFCISTLHFLSSIRFRFTCLSLSVNCCLLLPAVLALYR